MTMWIKAGSPGYNSDSAEMWRTNWFNLVMIYTLYCILDLVTSQCSESHRQTCYWSYLQLQELNGQSTPTYRYIPDFNATTLKTVCRYYNDYRNCSQPFLSSCDDNTIKELQTYDVTLGFICSDQKLFNEYLQHKTCFNRLRTNHNNCKQKGLSSMAQLDVSSSAYKYAMCRSARDYILCIYTATALGCSMQAAEVYFKLLNHSIGNIFKFHDYNCIVKHPMDVISIYTTTPPTTSTTLTTSTDRNFDRGDNSEPFKETSGCEKNVNSMTSVICYVMLVFSFYCDISSISFVSDKNRDYIVYR